MDIVADWKEIRKHFNKSFSNNFHFSIASVDADNRPTVTPIGSLFLNKDQSGFYFEKYPSKLPLHSETNKHICVLAVKSGTCFWLKALFRNRFYTHPAIKLYGTMGEKRKATSLEIKRLNRRMKVTRYLKGNAYLWGSMEYVRDITFTSAEKINLGEMTGHL